MRGIEEFNFPEFHKQAAWLRANGWKVFSPAERDEADPNIQKDEAGWADGLGLDYFMAHDLKAVCEMDCVILMAGWEASQGARLEAMVAVEIGHPVFEIVRAQSLKGWVGGQRTLKSVDNARVAAEFIAGTQATPTRTSGSGESQRVLKSWRSCDGYIPISDIDVSVRLRKH